MPVGPRRRRAVTATRAGDCRSISCCLVRLSWSRALLMRVSHRQRARSKVLAVLPLPASRLDPLSLSGDKRGRSKNLLFAVVYGTPLSDPELVTSLCWLAPAVAGSSFVQTTVSGESVCHPSQRILSMAMLLFRS